MSVICSPLPAPVPQQAGPRQSVPLLQGPLGQAAPPRGGPPHGPPLEGQERSFLLEVKGVAPPPPPWGAIATSQQHWAILSLWGQCEAICVFNFFFFLSSMSVFVLVPTQLILKCVEMCDVALLSYCESPLCVQKPFTHSVVNVSHLPN